MRFGRWASKRNNDGKYSKRLQSRGPFPADIFFAERKRLASSHMDEISDHVSGTRKTWEERMVPRLVVWKGRGTEGSSGAARARGALVLHSEKKKTSRQAGSLKRTRGKQPSFRNREGLFYWPEMPGKSSSGGRCTTHPAQGPASGHPLGKKGGVKIPGASYGWIGHPRERVKFGRA